MNTPLGSRYVLHDRLGRGASGAVFSGESVDGRPYAFKVLHAALARDPNILRRFVQERSVITGLDHPCLVRVHDMVVEGETVAMVMDLVRGGDLRAHLTAAGTLAPAEVARIGAGMASGLAAIHRADVIHRDVKPENVLMDNATEPASVRLTDFGMALLVEASQSRTSTLLVGTPHYIAPELTDGVEPSPAADLYSLGIVLYELCCGVTPFAGGSMMAVLRGHVERDPGRPEGVPDTLWDLISWLLEKHPSRRPQSAHQAAQALEALTVELAGVPAAPRLDSPPLGMGNVHSDPTIAGVAGSVSGRPTASADGGGTAPRRRRRGALIAAATLTALVLAGLGGTALATRDRGDDARPVADTAADAAGSSDAASTTSDDTSGNEEAEPVAEGDQDPEGTTDSDPSAEPDPITEPTPEPEPEVMASVVGGSLAAAEASLPDDVNVTTVEQMNDEENDGTILAQEPAPETALAEGDEVTLTVARRPVVVYLGELDPVTGDADRGVAATLSGEPYLHSLSDYVSCHRDDGMVEYNLGRDYRQLALTVGIEDSSASSDASVQLEVFADGRPVASHEAVYGEPALVGVDLTGVLRLRLQWQMLPSGDECHEGYLVFGSARLLGVPGEVPLPSDD